MKLSTAFWLDISPLKGGAPELASRAQLLLIAFATLCLFFTHSAGATEADDIPPSPIVKTQMLVDAQGKTGDAAVTFTMPPHWHIYWQNPGDSGIPTALEWTLPAGTKPGAIEWPAPERIEMSGLVNYGYSNQVTLPVRLTSHTDMRGEAKVKASWLVCRDICIPESAELRAPLVANAQGEKIIAAARERIPQIFDGNATFDVGPHEVTLTFTRNKPWDADAVRFSPIEDGIMANFPAGNFKQAGNALTLTLPRGTADVANPWHGVLHVTKDGTERAWKIIATNAGAGAPLPAGEVGFPSDAKQRLGNPGEGDVPQADNRPHPDLQPNASSGVWANPTSPAGRGAPNPAAVPPPTTHHSPLTTILLLAFLGGLILNIMPCVLPILALKALALAKKAAASRAAAARQGFSYTAGVVVSFLLIAAVMLALKASGNAIGWGFQLQNPAFVGFLALVMLLVSANLLGLFALPVLFGAKATAVDDAKLSGSFLTGALAVLVATPCTAPFMATAIGATLAMPTAQALAVFASLGLGMASPFLLISLWPAARRLIPKPGAWMHRFKQLLALPMLATAAWLIWVLVQLMNPAPIVTTGIHEPYSAARLSELRAAQKPVLVDATAAWCITCKINERVALNPAEMQAFFREKNVTILVADWTHNDPAITDYLASFGRNGVPLVVYYPPHSEPVVLPQVLTPEIVKAAILNE